MLAPAAPAQPIHCDIWTSLGAEPGHQLLTFNVSTSNDGSSYYSPIYPRTHWHGRDYASRSISLFSKVDRRKFCTHSNLRTLELLTYLPYHLVFLLDNHRTGSYSVQCSFEYIDHNFQVQWCWVRDNWLTLSQICCNLSGCIDVILFWWAALPDIGNAMRSRVKQQHAWCVELFNTDVYSLFHRFFRVNTIKMIIDTFLQVRDLNV